MELNSTSILTPTHQKHPHPHHPISTPTPVDLTVNPVPNLLLQKDGVDRLRQERERELKRRRAVHAPQMILLFPCIDLHTRTRIRRVRRGSLRG